MKNKMMVGAIETCGLPELNIEDLHVRIDTGAKTSSLHVDNIEEKSIDDVTWVTYDVHPDIHNVDTIVSRESKVKQVKKVKSSNGITEKRYLVETTIKMGNQQWLIDLTLTDRSEMTYLMLLGRQAMVDRIIVDPSESYLQSSVSENHDS